MSQVGRDSHSIRNNAGSSERVAIPQTDAPEKALTHFAMRLALLEKTATGLGTLGFIWATVVLLGGFAITLDTTDFWFITIILVIEGARIFSRSHELEWQHQATWSNADAFASSSGNLIQPVPPSSSITRDEENLLPPVQPQASSFFVTKNICKAWYLLQLVSAVACVVLSLIKLIMHNFGLVQKGDSDKRNRQAALFVFYSLVLAEASSFIMEKAYWEWTTRVCKLLENVNAKYELKEEGMISTRRFFYDAYTKSVNGSVFDSLRMDMVSFAVDLLNSNSPNEQLIGARLLRELSTNEKFSPVTLRKIGVDKSVIERLVEMLNWRNPNEQEIREAAAVILGQVASQRQNSLRIAGIPGAVESVASLLRTNRTSYTSAGDEICKRGDMSKESQYVQAQTYNELGLRILNELSRDHDNCWKIGNTKGLLPKIIDFTHTTECIWRNQNPHITAATQSLQLLKMLVSSTGITGSNLRKEISEIVFTVGNVRNILKNGEKYPEMQLSGIQVLTKLGLEDDATDKIGGTGGVLKELLKIFLMEAETMTKKELRDAAGDAIAMLTLESENNCHRVLQLVDMDNLVNALNNEALCINTARLLRNLCSYTEDARFKDTVLKVVETAPTVLNAIMIKPASTKQQEVLTGLALHVFKEMTYEKLSIMLQEKGYSEDDLAAALVKILKEHPTPSIEVPRIRRFAIELAIWMMNESEENIEKFRKLKIDELLAGVIETTTDVENFHLFSDFLMIPSIGFEEPFPGQNEKAASAFSFSTSGFWNLPPAFFDTSMTQSQPIPLEFNWPLGISP